MENSIAPASPDQPLVARKKIPKGAEQQKGGPAEEAAAVLLDRKLVSSSATSTTYKCVTSFAGFRRPEFTHHHDPANSLTTDCGDDAAAEMMIATAFELGWSPLKFTGTPEFMARAAAHAQRLGIPVEGYAAPEAKAPAKTLTPASEKKPEATTTQDPVPAGGQEEGMIKSLAKKDPQTVTDDGTTWENATLGQKLKK